MVKFSPKSVGFVFFQLYVISTISLLMLCLALSLIATVYDPTPKSFSAFWLIENGGHDDIHTLTNDFPLNLIKLILWIIYSLMRALIEEKMEEVVFEFLQLRASFVGLVFSLVPVVGPYLYILSYVFGASTIWYVSFVLQYYFFKKNKTKNIVTFMYFYKVVYNR